MLAFCDPNDKLFFKSASEPLANAKAYAVTQRGVGGSPLGLSLRWQGGNQGSSVTMKEL